MLDRPLPLHRLPPMKREALLALARGPLSFEIDVGWSNTWAGPFNSHTVQWLREVGAATTDDFCMAHITRAGLEMVAALEAIAA